MNIRRVERVVAVGVFASNLIAGVGSPIAIALAQRPFRVDRRKKLWKLEASRRR
ncbi:hypothetical protein [Paenibacillus sp. J23TS9]|uniref:hypothetical protein n=1 Tax=Paenibacillus sp. J23TS9 TaxID=2807193 RepID=UPI001BCDA9D5|nr:hypothetical protein [Paenibacillus sp. J23TS9]